MMYPYITFSDETEVTHSQVIDNRGQQIIEVHFERPTEIVLIQPAAACRNING